MTKVSAIAADIKAEPLSSEDEEEEEEDVPEEPEFLDEELPPEDPPPEAPPPEEPETDDVPDFEGDFDKLMTYHEQKKDDFQIEKARLRRHIIELESELKGLRKKANRRTGSSLSKKDRQLAAREVLSKYFSEAQISYLIDWKGNSDEKPMVRWSTRDLNKFARLKAQVRITGYNYIRRMNIVPMPSLNIIQKAHRENKLSPETVAIMEQKLRSKTGPSCMPKSGPAYSHYAKTEVEDPAVDKPEKRPKAAGNAAAAAAPENRRQMHMVMAAIQANALPAIVIRKKLDNNAVEERALFTPNPGTRTGVWNDAEFDTILHRRTVTGYSRQRPSAPVNVAPGGGGAARRRPLKRKAPESESSGNEEEHLIYDAASGAAAAYLKGDKGHITLIEQQAAIHSISSGGPAGAAVQAVPLTAAGAQGKVLHLNTINQLVLNPNHPPPPSHAASSSGNSLMLAQASPTFVPALQATAADQFQGQQVVYTDGQVPAHMIQSYQTVGYATSGTAASASQNNVDNFNRF